MYEKRNCELIKAVIGRRQKLYFYQLAIATQARLPNDYNPGKQIPR